MPRYRYRMSAEFRRRVQDRPETQRQLAIQIGASESSLSLFLAGGSFGPKTIDRLDRLAEIVGIDLETCYEIIE